MLIWRDVGQCRQAPTRCKEARVLARSNIKHVYAHVDKSKGVLWLFRRVGQDTDLTVETLLLGA